MPSHLQPFTLAGRTVWIEISDTEADPAVKEKISKTSAGAMAQQGTGDLARADLGPTLTAVFDSVHEALRAYRPSELNVEVALGIKGEVGFFIAKGEGNASLKVSAKWAFPPDSAPSSG